MIWSQSGRGSRHSDTGHSLYWVSSTTCSNIRLEKEVELWLWLAKFNACTLYPANTQYCENIYTNLGVDFDKYWPAILLQHGSNIFHTIGILSQHSDHIVNLGESWWIYQVFPIWSECCHNIKCLNIGTVLSQYCRIDIGQMNTEFIQVANLYNMVINYRCRLMEQIASI